MTSCRKARGSVCGWLIKHYGCPVDCYFAAISPISLPLSFFLPPRHPFLFPLTLWHHWLAPQDGKIISFGNRCGCVSVAALALTWQARLLTNARVPAHLRTRALRSARPALRQAAAQTHRHRGQGRVGCGNASSFWWFCPSTACSHLCRLAPPPNLRLERVTTSVCVCRHLLSPHNELTYGPGLTSLGVVILHVTGDTPVHRHETKSSRFTANAQFNDILSIVKYWNCKILTFFLLNAQQKGE